jgi:putative Mg2+ transporter-C (MgtC) family protein
MDLPMSTLEVVMRLSLALVLGAVLGWERERKHKPAGLRTMTMVSLGSAGFIILTLQVLGRTGTAEGAALFDPGRVIAGIVTGIGFIGAGAIIQSRGSVAGVTTAAGVWVVAGIGMACGFGEYVLAAILTGMTLIALLVVREVLSRMTSLPRRPAPEPDAAEERD